MRDRRKEREREKEREKSDERDKRTREREGENCFFYMIDKRGKSKRDSERLRDRDLKGRREEKREKKM